MRYILLIFIVGFISLIYEIYGVHVLFSYFSNNTYSAAIAISSFLGGIAFSALLFSHWSKSTNRHFKLLSWMLIFLCLYSYFVLSEHHYIPWLLNEVSRLSVGAGLSLSLQSSVMWIYLFVPAFFIGGAFPLISGLYLEDKNNSTRGVGIVYFWDTMGSIFGALIAGFYLLPNFDLKSVIFVPLTINFILIFAILIRGMNFRRIGGITIAAALLYLYMFNQLVGISSYPELDGRFGDVIFEKTSPYGTIRVSSWDIFGHEQRALFVNHRAMCSTTIGGEGESGELSLGINTGELLEDNSSVIGIGLGCGLTASALARHKNVDDLQIVEINPVVANEAINYFKDFNGDVLNMSHVHLNVSDGKDFLRETQRKFDAVVIDIEEPTIIYSSALYTKDYFDIIKSKLKKDGVLSLWSFFGNLESTKILYNTLRASYKSVDFEVQTRRGNSVVNFFASDKNIKIPNKDKYADIELKQQVIDLKLSLVNTIENQAIQGFYNIRKIFDLPRYYEERNFVKK